MSGALPSSKADLRTELEVGKRETKPGLTQRAGSDGNGPVGPSQKPEMGDTRIFQGKLVTLFGEGKNLLVPTHSPFFASTAQKNALSSLTRSFLLASALTCLYFFPQHPKKEGMFEFEVEPIIAWPSWEHLTLPGSNILLSMKECFLEAVSI